MQNSGVTFHPSKVKHMRQFLPATFKVPIPFLPIEFLLASKAGIHQMIASSNCW